MDILLRIQINNLAPFRRRRSLRLAGESKQYLDTIFKIE